MRGQDIEYYSRREQQERERAERTEDKGARRIHLELAARYSAMIREITISPAQAA